MKMYKFRTSRAVLACVTAALILSSGLINCGTSTESGGTGKGDTAYMRTVRMPEQVSDNRKIFTLEDFRGVDMDSDPVSVDARRAAWARNFCVRDGVLQKRKGWRQVAVSLPWRINGLWEFRDRLIIHAGSGLYMLKVGQDEAEALDMGACALADVRSQGVLYGQYLFIFGGGDAVRLSMSDGGQVVCEGLFDGASAYVPSTTVGIREDQTVMSPRSLDAVNLLTGRRINRICGDGCSTYTWRLDGSVDPGTAVEVQGEVRMDTGVIVTFRATVPEDGDVLMADSAEDFFALCQCFGETRYTLDGGAIYYTENVAGVRLKDGHWYPLEDGADAAGGDVYGLEHIKKVYGNVTWETIGTEEPATYGVWYSISAEGVLTVHEKVAGMSQKAFDILPVTAPGKVERDGWQIGYVNRERGLLTIGQGIFFPDVICDRPDCLASPVTGDDNITVTFTHTSKTNEEMARRLCRADFAAIFGAEGNGDRIFLGLADSHMVWYTERDNLSYIADNNYVTVGSSSHPVIGFLRVSDGVMAIFKDTDGDEPSIYYCQGTYNDVDTGDIMAGAAFRATFTVKGGNIGEVPVSRWCLRDFDGDPVMLSKNGLFGVSVRSQVQIQDRYAFERSRTVRRYIKKAFDDGLLTDVFGYCFDGMYYLSFNGICLVADSHVTYTGGQGIDRATQYEWYLYDHMPVRVMGRWNGRLYMGDADGRILLCGAEAYADETFLDMEGDHAFTVDTSEATETGGLDVGGDTFTGDGFDTLVSSETILEPLEGVKDGDRVMILSGQYEKLSTEAVTDGDGYISVGTEEDSDPDGTGVYSGVMSRIHEGMDIFVMGGGLAPGEYKVTDVDRGYERFRLADKEGQAVIPLGGRLYLACPTAGQEMTVGQVTHGEDGAVSFKLFHAWDDKTPLQTPVSLMRVPGHELSGIALRWFRRTPVIAEWYTSMMDMGNPCTSKVLDGLTAVAAVNSGGLCTVGFETGHRDGFDGHAEADGFDLRALDFRDVTLNGYARSASWRVNVRNVNFVRFRILSNEPEACGLRSLSAIYHNMQKIRGTR